jgi:hypothetical protein
MDSSLWVVPAFVLPLYVVPLALGYAALNILPRSEDAPAVAKRKHKRL